MNSCEFLIKGLMVAGIGCVFGLLLRKSSASKRHAVWLISTLVLTVLPLMLLVVPSWNLTFATKSELNAAQVSSRAPTSIPYPIEPAISSVRMDQLFAEPVTPPVDYERLFFLTWMGLAVVLILRQLIAIGIAAWLVAKSRRLSISDGIAVRVSYRLRTPAAVGFLRPTILIPASALEWKPERLSLVLAHESAHIRRFDWLWMNLASLMVALNAMNPLAWYIAFRLRIESEFACDDAVLAAGHDADGYAHELIAIARLIQGQIFAPAALGMARRYGLKDRVLALEDVKRPRGTVRRGVFSIALSSALLVGLPLAACRLGAQESQQSPPSGVIGVAINSSDAPIWQGSRTVKVTDSAGVPIPGARVAVLFDGGGWVSYADSYKSLTTSQDGICKFSNEDLIAKTARGVPAEATVFAVGHGISVATFAPDQKTAHVEMPDPSQIRLRLIDSSGRSVPGAMVEVRDLVSANRLASEVSIPKDWQQSSFGKKTDEMGEVVFQNLPAKLRVGLEVRHPDFVTLTAHTFELGNLIALDPIPIPESASTSISHTITLTRSGHLSGSVTSNGIPVANADLSATLAGGNGGVPTKSDSEGRYRFPGLKPGSYSVKVFSAPKDLVFRPIPNVTVDRRDISGLNFRAVKPGVVVGKIRYSDGTIPDRHLQLALSGPGYPKTDDMRIIDVPEGSFSVLSPAGIYDLYLLNGASDDPIANASHVQRVTIRSGLETRSTIILPAPGGPSLASSAKSFFVGGARPFFGPVKLRGHEVARLAFVQANGKQPWNPDGSTASPADVRRSLSFSDPIDSGAIRSIYARVDIDHAREDDDRIVQVPHRSEWTCWQSYGDNSGRVLDMATFRVPRSVKSSDLRIGVGDGPLKIVVDEPIGGPVLNARSDDRSIRVSIPAKDRIYDLKLFAIDRSGKSHSAGQYPTLPLGSEPKGGFEYRFNDVATSDIQRVQLQIRPWEWVTFTGVHLWPQE